MVHQVFGQTLLGPTRLLIPRNWPGQSIFAVTGNIGHDGEDPIPVSLKSASILSGYAIAGIDPGAG
jgi:hypothetical protein